MALNEAREKIVQLENAIQRLDFVKKHLSRNTSDIKKEIHSCVSRNLECLRGREVALLGQVDEVLAVKEEALHQQQAHLNQALGVLQTGMAMVKDDTASDRQLRETLQKLDRMELSPGETPHIAFRADHISLRESIVKYGRVDANSLSFAAFEDPDNPSASLPRHLEDYEDVDHHVFNKPVRDTGVGSITVSIPKLSNRMEDWLQKRIPAVPTQSPLVLPLTKLTPAVSLQQAPGKCGKESTKSNCSTPSDACSLNNWLSLIKNHADLEEEHDFEIVDNSSTREAGSETESVDIKCSGSSDFFSHIEKDLKMWISTASSGRGDVKEEKGTVFHHIPQEAEFWLSKASQQLCSLEETVETDFFKHISNQPSTWLRSRAHAKQQTGQTGAKKDYDDKTFKHSGKEDLSQWLLGKKAEKRVAEEEKENVNAQVEKDDEKWLQKNSTQGCNSNGTGFQLEEVCRANELCSSPGECVSQPICAAFCQLNSVVKNPIDPLTAFKPQKLPMDQWLSPSKKAKAVDGAPNDCHRSLPASIVSCSPAPPTWRVGNFKSSKEEANQWLREGHQSAPDTGLVSSMSGSSLSDWLLSPSPSIDIKPLKEREHELEKESSEGWSLCSSPSSTGGEQFTKDVEIATDYMKKWILSSSNS